MSDGHKIASEACMGIYNREIEERERIHAEWAQQSAELTALRESNEALKADIQTLIKCVPDQNWNSWEDNQAFYDVAEKYQPQRHGGEKG